MERKIKECVYPYKHGCYGCEYNIVPTLYDGGCKLYGKAERGSNGGKEDAERTHKDIPQTKSM